MTQAHLAEQFAEKSVHRVYWAIVFGAFKEEQGTIKTTLARHPKDRKRFASLPEESSKDGKIAITHYQQVEKGLSGLSLVHLKLETGRTHQIRVHMFEKHHAIVGDPIYAGIAQAKNLKSIELRKWIQNGRLALHAAELGFVHPASGKRVSFKVDWPDDLKPLLNLAGLSQ